MLEARKRDKRSKCRSQIRYDRKKISQCHDHWTIAVRNRTSRAERRGDRKRWRV